MKKLLFICLSFTICMLLSAPVAAQIYKYQTDDGQVVYTNDYAQIPARYRDQITGYEETVEKNTVAVENGEEELNQEIIAAKRQEFAVTTQELNDTFQALTEKQKTLEARRDSIPLDDDNAWADFNAHMVELNLEIDAYKKRSETFVKELEEFNQRIAEFNKKSLGKNTF